MFDQRFNCILAVYSKELDFFVPLFQSHTPDLASNVGATAVAFPVRAAVGGTD
jgi:hypothetical protein